MKVPPHVVRLYTRTARQYRKVVSRLQRQNVSPYQRNTYLQKIKKLLRLLRNLEGQLKFAVATGTLVLTLNLSQAQTANSSLGPFVRQDRMSNPLREPVFNGGTPSLAVVDLDKDGDLDAVLGEYDYWYGGYLRYFENQTAQGFPVYKELFDEDNPFDGIRAATSAAAPAFADIDGDGDEDLFIGQLGYDSYYGNESGGVEYYRNDDGVYSRQEGTWDEATKEGNPLDEVSLSDHVRPVFVDFDKDGDLDVIIGSYVWTGYPDYRREHIHYYENNGSGTFAPSPFTINQSLYAYYSIAPAVADLDADGDYDIVIGAYNYDRLVYLRQVSPGSFDVQWGDWDPALGTGNPLDNFTLGANSSPVFIDFNNDGLLDIFVADESGYYKYSDYIINYYENKGNSVFEEKFDFENPFGGAYVHDAAAPVLIDVDGDTDLDAVIGNKYYRSYYDYNLQEWVTIDSYLTLYKKEEQSFLKAKDEENPFNGFEVYGWFTPQFADADGDLDNDVISGDYWGDITFLRKEGNEYIHEVEVSPFAGINHAYNSVAQLVDLDNDQDLDLFMTNSNGEFLYFENTGTAQAPVYTERFDEENPLADAQYNTWYTPFLNFADLDNDGDLDALFNGSSPYNVESQAYLFFENTGTPDAPSFTQADEDIFSVFDDDVRLNLVDYDGDGDLDAFTGNEDGTVSYFVNENPAATVTLTGGVVNYENGTDPVPVDADLTLTDEDNDQIVMATVTIQDYQSGETLGFTPVDGIEGAFDAGTGILTFRGKASVDTYQALLRSVAFEVTYQSGRRVPSKKTIVAKNISFTVFDADFTDPVVRSRSLEVFINDPPAVGTTTVEITAGGLATVDLKQLVSDPNGSADIDLASLEVVTAPGSGAATSIDGNGILTIDYDGLSFLGQETLVLQVCDLDGLCAQNTLTLSVTNTPPVIDPEPVATPSGTSKTINLMTITSDVDGNLDPDGFSIVTQPLSGALASIQIVSASEVNLLLDYEGITFHGTDELTLKACDVAGACSESVMQVEVDVDDVPGVVVYNAVAPNSAGDNKFMRIHGLPGNHKVSIFNRWGDRVFDTEDYGSSPFKGNNNSGSVLASGTYFYSIEIPGEKLITGFLTLKQ